MMTNKLIHLMFNSCEQLDHAPRDLQISSEIA